MTRILLKRNLKNGQKNIYADLVREKILWYIKYI